MIKEEFLNENFTGEQPVTGLDVAKLSDDASKTMSRSQQFVDFLRRTLNWRIQSGK